MNILNNVKSNFVKLFAALVLAFMAVVAIQTFTTNNSTTQTVQAAKRRKLSKRERAAKRWIAMRESGGNYQLNIAYLHGNYSKKNQERVADNYVYGRYGSWVNAKKFWLAHHWY